MPKLILSMDGLVLKEVELIKERTTIGRRPHNDIVIDNLAVSGEHAVLITILNDSFIEDLGSTNGTTVNSQPIKKHFLQPNDTVELGKYKLKFVADVKSTGTDYTKVPPRAEEPLRAAPATRTASSTSHATTGPSMASTAGVAVLSESQLSSTRSRIDDSVVNGASRSGASANTASQIGAAATIQILNGPNAGKELMLHKSLTTLGRPGSRSR